MTETQALQEGLPVLRKGPVRIVGDRVGRGGMRKDSDVYAQTFRKHEMTSNIPIGEHGEHERVVKEWGEHKVYGDWGE